MSQHIFRTVADGQEIEVLAGWDRPLQGFFLVIQDDDRNVLASNLDLPVSHPKDFSEFQPMLGKYGIVLPEEMISEIIIDGVSNMGNKQVIHKIENGKHFREKKY